MTIAAQFVNLLKEENVHDAMNLIKTALTEQSKAKAAEIGVEVAASFKLSEKMKEEKDPKENPEDDKDKQNKE